MPTVSIITPTWNRATFLPRIAACVLAQQEIDWEWLVLDDSPEPSAFMQDLAQRDTRVRYWHSIERQRIGSKRNQLIGLATSDVVAHFDDDDYYGPRYLKKMVGTLQEQNADLIKLSAFYMLAPEARQVGQANPGFLGYMDLNAKTGWHYELIHNTVGMIEFHERRQIGADFIVFYGFSYVYKKALGQSALFDDIDLCDDESFAKRALAAGCKFIAVDDPERDCLHLVHGTSTARCFAAYSMPMFLLPQLFPGYQ